MALTAAPATAPASDLVGDWRFDETSGQVALDRGPLGLDGRLGAEPGPDAADPLRIPGRSGAALRFDGAGFVRLPDGAETGPARLTMEAVVRAPASPGTHRYIVARGSYRCVAGSYGLYTATGGGAAFYIFDGERYYLTPALGPSQIWDGTWHHLAGTFDGSRLRLFLDGRPVGPAAEAPVSIDYGVRTTSSTYFGSYESDTCRRPFAGDIDSVRLWSSALDAEAMAQAAESPGSRPVANPAPVLAEQPATVLPAPDASGKPATAQPGSPPRACRIRVAPRRPRPGRRRIVVKVAVRGTPVAGVLVSLRRDTRRSRPVRARTGADGRAKLRLRVKRRWRYRVNAVYEPRCATVRVRPRRR